MSPGQLNVYLTHTQGLCSRQEVHPEGDRGTGEHMSSAEEGDNTELLRLEHTEEPGQMAEELRTPL